MSAERQHYSASEIVREALRSWAAELLNGIAPAAFTVGTADPSEGETIPTLGIAWGAVDTVDSVPFDEEVFEGELPADARGVWRLHTEDVALAFVWRANTPEDADFFAHEFATRAKLAAMESNDEGSPVLHFSVTYAGGMSRTGRLYLDGPVIPEASEEALLRSLYTFRVPGSVVYPVMRVENAGEATGQMSVILVINGKTTALSSLEEGA